MINITQFLRLSQPHKVSSLSERGGLGSLNTYQSGVFSHVYHRLSVVLLSTSIFLYFFL